MEGNERLQDYLLTVAGCIRWKRARAPLLRELSDHIEDQKKDFAALGMNEDEAMERSVGEMGDPVAVGKELDRLHRPKTSWGLILGVAVILALGIFVLAFTKQGDLFTRQILALVGGVILMSVLWLGDYTVLIRKLWLISAALITAFITMSVLFSVGRNLGLSEYFTIQRAYPKFIYLYLLTPILYAALLCRLRGRGYVAVLGLGLLVLPLAALPTLIPDMSTTLLCTAAMLAALSVAIWKGWFHTKRLPGLICGLSPALTAGFWYFHQLLTMSSRIEALFHPERYSLEMGFEYNLVRRVLSRTPFFRIPTPQEPLTSSEVRFIHDRINNDFDLTWLATRFGGWIILAAGLVTVFFVLLMLWRVSKLKSVSGQLIALPCVTTIAVQSIGYLATNLGWRFLGAGALPLFTYGPGYLLVDLILIGILLSVFRMDALVRDVTAHKALSVPEQLHIPLGPWDIHINRRE